jgi:hypothetical protein
MEYFLIIIIIVLVYLLFRKKSSNNLKEDLTKDVKTYGKAFKQASSSFMSTLKEENNIKDSTVSDDDNITVDDLNNLPKELKKGIEYTSVLLKNMYAGFLTTDEGFESPYSQEFLRDELISGFNGMLISHSLKKFSVNASKLEKGISVASVFFNLSPKLWSEINKDFIKISFNPTNQSKRGTELANKLIDIVENVNTEKWDNDEDIAKAKKNEHIFENEIKAFSNDNAVHNTGLMMSFFVLHIGDYLEKYRLSDSQ